MVVAQAKRPGVKLGAAVQMDPAVDRRIMALRKRGLSFAKIAERLNADGYAPPSGVKFDPCTVNSVVRRLVA